MRSIAVITGTRAEYGILIPVLKAIQKEPNLKLHLIVTGMHLAKEFGYTAEVIKNDGFDITSTVDMLISGDTPEAMSKSIGLGVIGMSSVWQQLRPDIILILGDRIEPLAAAISGAYMNIPVAHIHGGDVCGTIDSMARHSITNFSHIHFAATEKSAQRIKNMGEEEWRIHVTGSPALDVVLNETYSNAESLANKYSIDFSQPLILLLQHSITTQNESAGKQMKTSLDAIKELGYATIVVYPNSDAGGRQIIETIKIYRQYPWIKTFKNLPRPDFLGLMKAASVLVGNSSSGIIEAPSLGLPVINIGIRQEGREKAGNIIDVEHDKAQIIRAIKKALSDEVFLSEVNKKMNPYGDGQSANRIAMILSELEITSRLLQKKFIFK